MYIGKRPPLVDFSDEKLPPVRGTPVFRGSMIWDFEL
jgi:hypothetical protein